MHHTGRRLIIVSLAGLIGAVVAPLRAEATHLRCFSYLVPHNAEHLGTNNNDTLNGTAADDVMHALGGDLDYLYPVGGNDRACGGDGYDVIDGGAGHDRLSGGGTDDTIQGSGGNDTIYGGTSNDDLFGEDGADQVHDGFGADWLSGGPGTDTLYVCDNDAPERYINGFENVYLVTC